MTDSLLSARNKKKILKSIGEKKYFRIIAILEKIKTKHAGTAKTKDKRFVIREMVKFIIDNSRNQEKDFYDAGLFFCKRKEDVAKEIGISLIWRGYKYNPGKVKEYLLKTADDTNWEVREYAATAFADTLYCNGDFYKDLMKWSKHKSENVRRAVVFSALALKDSDNLDKAFAILEPLLYDDSKYVKKNLGPFILGSHFGNRFPEETIKRLNKWSKITDSNVRWNIIMSFNNSFGNSHPEEALAVIKYFTGDTDPVVKRAMLSTLNFLSKRHKKLTAEFAKTHNINVKKKTG